MLGILIMILQGAGFYRVHFAEAILPTGLLAGGRKYKQFQRSVECFLALTTP